MNYQKGINPEYILDAYVYDRKVILKQLIEDSIETISLLDKDLRQRNFNSEQDIYCWFMEKLYLTGKESIYRAYLCLTRQEIFNLRVSNHSSNIKTTKRSWKAKGSPDIEYHLIIEKVPLIKDRNDKIDFDGKLLGNPILVDEFSFSDFNNPNKKGDIIDLIIDIITNGSVGNTSKRIKKITKTYENIRYVGILNYINEHKYINKHKMKALTQYISEQMVCELSTDVIHSAYLKSWVNDRGEGRSKYFLKGLLAKTADEAVSKVKKLGYDSISGGEHKYDYCYQCINEAAEEYQIYCIMVIVNHGRDGVIVTYELEDENTTKFATINSEGYFKLNQRTSNRKLARSIVRLVKALVPQIQVTMDSVLKVD